MIIASAVASTIQVAALFLAGLVSIEVVRKQTLSKNFEWVLENQDFAKKYDRPGIWPLYASTILVVVLLAYGLAIHSLQFMFWGKTAGILSALVFLSVYYYLLEKSIGNRIPLRKERTATLAKRSIDHYIPRRMFFLANAAALSVSGAFVVSLLLHKITLATFIYDLAGALLCYGSCYGGILWTMNEKIPHKNDTTIVTNIDVSENYRKFSLNLLLVMSFCISGLLLLELGLQWFGYGFYADPVKDGLYRLLGEPVPSTHIISQYTIDLIASIFSVPVFLYIARCKAYRDIRTISVVR